ncbi:hypothetical protein GCK72_025908 [Caenorhabditis remanei]|uniref:C2H2-type domain-containing protein n=1 Tax=Caenorhabditis remanei TaxID=31234 RepID=A0A6A5G3F7_CAERE|nr:hypothetical protein GCK72_025908 [Caenorhabditis remanei]KAF1749440.1 hypothetical protein GCK72_025908 [Caenorhabditis remanei]
MTTEIQCYYCKELTFFPSLDELEAHIAFDHLGLAPYECESCKYARFPTEYALAYHSKDIHNTETFMMKIRYNKEVFKNVSILKSIMLRYYSTHTPTPVSVPSTSEKLETMSGINVKVDGEKQETPSSSCSQSSTSPMCSPSEFKEPAFSIKNILT